MDNDINQQPNPRNGKALAGIILLAVGAMLLFRQFSFFFIPDWLFSWQMLLIAIGLFIGAKSNFHNPSSIILILIGVVFLIGENVPHAGNIEWPLMIIAFGLWLILRRHNPNDKDYWKKKYEHKWDWRNHTGFSPNNPPSPGDPATGQATTDYTQANATGSGLFGDNYLDAVSVFGGVKKTILSKDFKGGEVVNIFGGAEIDFTQADINGRIILDITQIFGGTKIIVPSHWQVVSDVAAVFASVDDKRMRSTAALNGEKVLVLKGVSIFAGIDIRSF